MLDGLEQPDELVTVSIWLNSEFFQQKGHLTLRTYRGGPNNTGIYASFWPHGRNDSKYMGAEFTVSYYPGGCFRTANYDLLKVNQGQPPDYKIHLRGFDINKINNEFLKILDEELRFSIYGSIYPLNATLKTANCAQVVHRLLQAGGLTSQAERALRYFVGIVLSSFSIELMIKSFGFCFSKYPHRTKKIMSLFPPFLMWITAILISRSSRYKGSTVMPILSNLYGLAYTSFMVLFVVGFAGEKLGIFDFQLAMLFFSLPVSYFPTNFQIESLLKSPENMYRLLSNLSGVLVEKKDDSQTRNDYFNRFVQFINRNKWPIGIILTGITTFALSEPTQPTPANTESFPKLKAK